MAKHMKNRAFKLSCGSSVRYDLALRKPSHIVMGDPWKCHSHGYHTSVKPLSLTTESYPSLIEVVFRGFANRISRHWDRMPILPEDLSVLVARRPDSHNPEKLNRMHRVTCPLYRRALLKTIHTSLANDRNNISQKEPC
ncbi:hypothetical protein SAMN05443507_11720 [Alicyclobacillus tolerans]|uniref:Uncharacterized protein n=1 Tax=Alicyclobacillus tolerans TaxID=90970 RepID=A0A1M6TMT0_9BACL|nr:hypothetical protein SAMN05443507_11720 [Alicyclobacillus montanus]